jgi:uncharacterized protein YdbL (DUF1318 family)
MKKLLALILCVMMFVAVIPTSAFAAGKIDAPMNLRDTSTASKFVGTQAAKDAIKDSSDAINAMYGALAADQGVFTTVKAIDGVVTDLAKDLFKDVDKLELSLMGIGASDISKSKAEDKTKAFLRASIGAEITKYMNEHLGSFVKYDSTGTVIDGVDPVKYWNTFATAASKAVSGEKAQKNIEALVYTTSLAKAFKEINDKQKDLYDEVASWEGNDNLFKAYGFTQVAGNKAYNRWLTPYAFIDGTDVDITDKVYAGDGSTILEQWLTYAP